MTATIIDIREHAYPHICRIANDIVNASGEDERYAAVLQHPCMYKSDDLDEFEAAWDYDNIMSKEPRESLWFRTRLAWDAFRGRF